MLIACKTSQRKKKERMTIEWEWICYTLRFLSCPISPHSWRCCSWTELHILRYRMIEPRECCCIVTRQKKPPKCWVPSFEYKELKLLQVILEVRSACLKRMDVWPVVFLHLWCLQDTFKMLETQQARASFLYNMQTMFRPRPNLQYKSV